MLTSRQRSFDSRFTHDLHHAAIDRMLEDAKFIVTSVQPFTDPEMPSPVEGLDDLVQEKPLPKKAIQMGGNALSAVKASFTPKSKAVAAPVPVTSPLPALSPIPMDSPTPVASPEPEPSFMPVIAFSPTSQYLFDPASIPEVASSDLPEGIIVSIRLTMQVL